MKKSNFLIIILFAVGLGFTGCAAYTVKPTIREDAAVVDGNTVGRDYISIDKDKGYLISPEMRSEYNGLIDIYGHGTEAVPMTPPLQKDDGLTQEGENWRMLISHRVKWLDMRKWRDNGIAPRTIIQKILQ